MDNLDRQHDNAGCPHQKSCFNRLTEAVRSPLHRHGNPPLPRHFETSHKAVIGVLKKASVIDNRLLLVIITVFYVCDLICVLFWCPFKEWVMKNRCCNTCRIFNWDYFMMFLPGIFCKGFFTISLLAMSLITLAIWEIYNMKYPERFWEGSNDAIKCRNCTEYLCGRRK